MIGRTVLQYYVATYVIIKYQELLSCATFRETIEIIKERLNGKGGRVRGNLMGKRVDFSAQISNYT